MRAERESPGLRREIGFAGLLAFSVGINIGAGLFVLVNVAAEIAGPSMTISILVAALPAMIALVPYTVLARGYPTTAATYRYVQLASPRLARTLVATVIAAILIGALPLFATIAGEAVSEVTPIGAVPVGVASLVLFAAVNAWGVRPTAVAQITLVIAMIAALLLYVALGVGSIERENLTPFWDGGAPGMLVASGILFALMAGGLFIIDVGEEVIDPRRIFGWVLPLGMVIVLAIYIGVLLVTAGAVPVDRLIDETLIVAGEQFMDGVPFAAFVLGGVLIAAVTTLNITYTLVTRAMLAVAQDGLIPRVIGRVDPRTGTPTAAIIVAWAVGTAAFLADLPTRFLGTMLNIGLVLAISGVALAGFVVADRHPAIFEAGRGVIGRRLLRTACVAVITMNTLILLLLCAASPAAALTVALVAGVTALVAHRSGAAAGPMSHQPPG